MMIHPVMSYERVFVRHRSSLDNWCSTVRWTARLCAYTIWCCGVCVCTVVSSGCSQYSQKWWGRVRLLLGVMRLPAAPHCLTKSPSVSLPSRLVFAQHHASPLNHTCTNIHTHMYNLPLPPFLNVYCISLSFSSLCLIHCLGIFLVFFFLFCEALLFTTLRPLPLLLLLSPLSAGVLCNWAVVNSTLAWISSIATPGWRCWPLQTQAK